MVPISALSYYEQQLEDYYVKREPKDYSDDEEFDEDAYYDKLYEEQRDRKNNYED